MDALADELNQHNDPDAGGEEENDCRHEKRKVVGVGVARGVVLVLKDSVNVLVIDKKGHELEETDERPCQCGDKQNADAIACRSEPPEPYHETDDREE